MSKLPVDMGSFSILSESTLALREHHKQQAEQLLEAYHHGDEAAVSEFRQRIPGAQSPDFVPTLLHARLLVSSSGLKVKNPSLEKLKKDAKDLLKALKSGQAAAFERWAKHHNKTPNEVKLADAQLIVARENSFISWARAKQHITQVVTAKQRIQQPEAVDADLKTLHIRCGNDIKSALESGGFVGDFLEICNPFPMGQVPHFLPREPFIEARANFLRDTFADSVPPERIDSVASTLRVEEETLSQIDQNYERVVLWFEHDSYDQLCKAYVLAHLALNPSSNVVVECIQVKDFPGLQKFIGIGQVVGQRPEMIYLLWSQRRKVSQTMINFGSQCWYAFTNNDPTRLWQLVQSTPAVCTIMSNAMMRTLMELPWAANGLSLTEFLALDILANGGPMRPGAIFSLLMSESEPLPYLGDIMLASMLRQLSDGEQAAIEVVERYPDEHPMRQTLLRITSVGKALIAGQANWLELQHADRSKARFVGGVQISPAAKNWCWHPGRNRPVLK